MWAELTKSSSSCWRLGRIAIGRGAGAEAAARTSLFRLRGDPPPPHACALPPLVLCLLLVEALQARRHAGQRGYLGCFSKVKKKIPYTIQNDFFFNFMLLYFDILELLIIFRKSASKTVSLGFLSQSCHIYPVSRTFFFSPSRMVKRAELMNNWCERL